MNPILAELDYKKSSSFRRFVAYFLLILVTIIFAIYVGNVFFGSRSASVLYDLKEQKDNLNSEVKRYQELNSALQKEYFELIGLDPDSYK
ncbi:MAG: septum formation initiator [Campylobacter lanienae]|uniref:septum formation initiator n=1 Tax=Campylobacter lanienae TaxID=75658 RepID=UPI00242E933C|nr:septum formation initiator [Campylobacter lanienae]MCI7364169.1 septum formation initiator [Campylobacter lanienae]